jgi:2-dehydro-3-deoxygalactonokinase
MSTLDPSGYEAALLEVIGPWLSASHRCPVIGCGMVGSKQGWVEVPYLAAPCSPLGRPVDAPVSDPRIRVLVCPGIKQEAPPDVMRGEETQIAGLLALQPDFEGVVCLPGTHSKWVRVSAAVIQSFQTFLTGELFALLARESVLRHSVDVDGWDEDAFLKASAVGLAAPEAISAKLFSIRAESLLHQVSGASARSRLSGYLIAWELAATRPLWTDGEVAIIGATDLAEVYASGLRAAGASATVHPGETLTLAGLRGAYDRLELP